MSESSPPYGKSDELQRFLKSEEGLTSNELNDFEVEYKVSKRQMANLLGVSEKTYYNILSDKSIDSSRSDRFLQVHKVFTEGKEVFMSENNFMDWLQSPQSTFGDRKPMNMLQSITGLEAVYSELIRIKHGVLA